MMRKSIILVTAIAAVLAFTGCSQKAAETAATQTETTAAETTTAETAVEEETAETEAESEEAIGMPNPWSDHKNLADAEAAAGFEIEIPDEISGTNADTFRTLDSDAATLEVIYNDGKGEERARIRKAPGKDDISGDYNDYSDSKDVDVDGKTVTMKGNDGKIMLASWQDGDYTYSVTTTVDGVSEADMTAIAEAVK